MHIVNFLRARCSSTENRHADPGGIPDDEQFRLEFAEGMSGESASLTANGELAGCVKSWRRRLDPGAWRAAGKCRRRGNITQEEMAEAIGVSVVWYSKLERGVRANYSDAFLDMAAKVLRLSADERALLYLLAAGRKLPPLTPDAATAAPDRGLCQVVTGQRWPAYVLNRYSRIVLHNEPCESYYPWLRDDSDYPRWLLTSADARQRLMRWEDDWAVPLLAQLRLARAQHPRDVRIAAMIDTCLSASPDARRLWDAYADHIRVPCSRRGIRLPETQQATTVDVVTLTDLRPSELRVVMLIPAPGPPREPRPD
jgi:transcriptional regulator with XRE-family HTH domain